MKKQIFALVFASLICLLCIPAMAQGQTQYEDVVYLKNGSIFRGMIIEQVPNVSLKIQTADRNVFAFRIDEIEKITKEEVQTVQVNKSKPEVGQFKQKGVTCIIELNIDRIDFDDHGLSAATGFQTTVGYLVNPYFSAGIGTGLMFIPDESIQLPLYADLRYNMIKKSVTPFISTGVGYSFGLTNTSYNRGGLLVNANLGIKFFVSPKTAMNFSLGFRYQEYVHHNYYDYYYGYYDHNDRGAHKFLNISMGFTL
jgi:hypothetical protein